MASSVVLRSSFLPLLHSQDGYSSLNPLNATISTSLATKKQKELEKLADELREDIVYTVSKTGGHLSSSLGVAELTVALHHVFNTPEDKIIWDVGHQGITKQMGSQTHKIAAKVDSYMRGMVAGSEDLVHILKKVKAMPAPGPVLIHIVTEKGKGYAPAEVAADKMHGAKLYMHMLILIFIGQPMLWNGVVHDVDLQKLPVRFAMDRAGLVGADGPTHCGAFDTTFMACLPNMVVMAPSCEAELMHMVATAAAIDDRPSCFRYPRGNGIGSILPLNNKGIPLELLQALDISITVADARFCKPLDGNLIRQLAQEHEVLITVEEGSIGGFSSHVSHYMGLNGLLDGNLKWRAMVLPDRYIDHGAHGDQIEEAGLTSKHIAATVLSLMGSKESLRTLNL
ncbi:hypothetical protein C3L33_03821, partial [Rhododendron williamsianum]